jgi:SAM-dependent methyltransferase
VAHLDSVALATVESLVGRLITGPQPVILDLMASWDSHIPDSVRASKVVGLGLNRNELTHNRVLTEFIVHDLNRHPGLPFDDASFDAVINTVSVDYMTKPFEIFAEVARILKPGGLFLVIFSNRFFPQKATRLWRDSKEGARVVLVKDFFRSTPVFDAPEDYLSAGRPRPKDDKYAHLGIPSDPIYAVYARKKRP